MLLGIAPAKNTNILLKHTQKGQRERDQVAKYIQPLFDILCPSMDCAAPVAGRFHGSTPVPWFVNWKWRRFIFNDWQIRWWCNIFILLLLCHLLLFRLPPLFSHCWFFFLCCCCCFLVLLGVPLVLMDEGYSVGPQQIKGHSVNVQQLLSKMTPQITACLS